VEEQCIGDLIHMMAQIEALKLIFRLDGSNPYKDDAYNINRFKPMSRYEEADCHTYLIPLHSDMEAVNKYVAIQDLIRHMFSTQHTWVPSTSENIKNRYMYSTALHEYLHQSKTPSAKTRRRGIETPPRTVSKERKEEEEYNFDEVQEEPKQNVWISKTIKRAKEWDQRMTAREKAKQRLTMATPPSPPKLETAVATLFDSEDEESEEEAEVVDRAGEEKQ
jgi:hypothetical protein